MSSNDIVIRHVRLCSCGKVAGHNSICRPGRTPSGLTPDDVERVPARFEDETSERAHARFDRRKREFASDRRARFARMDPLTLHRWVMENAVSLSTVAGGSIEPTRGGSERTPAPPRQQTLEDDPRWREHTTVLRRRLEGMAELVLEAQGHSTVASTANMTGSEKDKLILSREHEGLRAQAVVDRLGSHIAGSASTVRRVRAAAHLDHLGYPRETDR